MTPETITHRRVLNVALPIVLANITVPLLGLVDTKIIGRLGEVAPVGAVGIGAIILTALYWVFGFLRMGTAGLTGQASGAGDRGEVAALLMRALMIGAAAGVVLIAAQGPLFLGAFWISPASAEVERLARDYMSIRILSAPAAIALYGITGWLIAQERTRAVLVLQLWINGVNVVLNLLFVIGFAWGISGVAFATFLAEWSGLVLGLWLCRDAFRGGFWRDSARVFDRARLWRMASVNVDIMIRSVLLEAAFVSFLFIGSDFGDVTLVANHILLQFLHLTAHAMDGFAFSAEALVGQALGARQRATLRRSAGVTLIWGAVIGGALSLAFWLFGSWAIHWLNPLDDVRAAAETYLPYVIAAPIAGAAAWMLDGVFIGATETRVMRNMMGVSFLAFVLAVVVLVPWVGNHGLWLAMLSMFVVRGVTLAVAYPRLEARAA